MISNEFPLYFNNKLAQINIIIIRIYNNLKFNVFTYSKTWYKLALDFEHFALLHVDGVKD